MSERLSISCRVYGKPMPKGSKTAVVRGGRAVLLDARRAKSRRQYNEWGEAVVAAATKEALRARWREDCARAYVLSLVFYMPRPKARKRDVYVTTRPDLDKLTRTVKDCLTDAQWIIDDSQVVAFEAPFDKRYETPDEPPGVKITLSVL